MYKKNFFLKCDFIFLKQFVVVYDFVLFFGKYGRLELAFQVGERINVYGEERSDGFYYGEINGSWGLVFCFFIQEVLFLEYYQVCMQDLICLMCKVQGLVDSFIGI